MPSCVAFSGVVPHLDGHICTSSGALHHTGLSGREKAGAWPAPAGFQHRGFAGTGSPLPLDQPQRLDRSKPGAAMAMMHAAASIFWYILSELGL